MDEKQTEWMYSGTSKPDPEQYLLGRKIDSAIDPTQDDNDPMDWISGAVPQDGDITARAEMWKTRDAFAKAREDPMFVIEKQKRSAHVDFRNNPLKMQKVRDLLASELKKDLKKKKKKRKQSRDEEEPAPSSSKKGSSSADKSGGRGRSRSPARPRHRDRSPDRSRDRRSRSRDRRRSRSPDRRRSRSPDRRRSRSPDKDRKRRSRSGDKEVEKKPANSKPAYKPINPKYPIPRGGSGISKRMTAEELERKRAEMMSNATTRDTDRKDKYHKRKDTEAADTQANEEDKAGFIHKFKVDSYSASNTSVENRIKSGIFTKQRTKADMNTFLKK